MSGMDTGAFQAVTNGESNMKCRWHQANIKELQEAVFGNGHDGLKTNVTKLREQMKLLLWLNGIVASATMVAVIIALVKLLFAQ